MAKIQAYLKAILIVILKLILMLLKKRGKDQNQAVKDNGKSCLHKRTSRKDALEETQATKDSSSMTSLSSGIGSSICSTDSNNSSSQGDEILYVSSQFGTEIERLCVENKVLRQKLSNLGPRNVHKRNAIKTCPGGVYSRSDTSLTHHEDIVTSTPRSSAPGIHDIVRAKLKLKLQLEREENSRLHNYINDVVYMVLETSPSLLEK